MTQNIGAKEEDKKQVTYIESFHNLKQSNDNDLFETMNTRLIHEMVNEVQKKADYERCLLLKTTG